MVGRVLFAVDGSLPSRDAAVLADGLLPKATEVLVLQVVPQLPYAWTAWPAFPNPGEDLARASAYVSEVGQELEAAGWPVNIKVHLSVLSAAEMDREILNFAQTLRPDLICLALAQGRVAASIVREAVVPVLVAKSSASGAGSDGHRGRRRQDPEPELAHRSLLLTPAAALIFRKAGIL